MIIHFMLELKLLKEYNSFSQKEELKESSQSNIQKQS